jgi:hypothetical protein
VTHFPEEDHKVLPLLCGACDTGYEMAGREPANGGEFFQTGRLPGMSTDRRNLYRYNLSRKTAIFKRLPRSPLRASPPGRTSPWPPGNARAGRRFQVLHVREEYTPDRLTGCLSWARPEAPRQRIPRDLFAEGLKPGTFAVRFRVLRPGINC